MRKVDGIFIPELGDDATACLEDYILRNAPAEIQKRLQRREMMKKKNLEEQDDQHIAGKSGTQLR